VLVKTLHIPEFNRNIDVECFLVFAFVV